MRLGSTVQLLVCLLIHTQDLTAQWQLPVIPGQIVRIRTECRKFYTDNAVGLGRECPVHVGNFVAADSAMIVVMDESGDAEIAVMRDAVRHFDVYRGTKRFGIGKGAGLGLVAGGVSGAVIAESQWGVPIGMLLGGLVGGLIKYESWEAIPLYDSAGRRVASSNRCGLTISLRF